MKDSLYLGNDQIFRNGKNLLFMKHEIKCPHIFAMSKQASVGDFPSTFAQEGK